MAKIAIIETGGKQYVVTQDSVLDIEKLAGSPKVGDKVTFDIRYRQKSRYFKKKGHRQPYAKVRITSLP